MRDLDELLELSYSEMDGDEIEAIIEFKTQNELMAEKTRMLIKLTEIRNATWAENATAARVRAMDDFERELRAAPSFTIPEYAGGD